MNEIVNKFLLARDKFMPEMHLKQPGFNYSAFGSFTRNKQRIQKLMQTGDTRMNWIKFVFSMTWLMEALKTYKEEHNQIKS